MPVVEAEPLAPDLVAVIVEALLVVTVDKAVVVAVELPERAVAVPVDEAEAEEGPTVPPSTVSGAMALATLAAAAW